MNYLNPIWLANPYDLVVSEVLSDSKWYKDLEVGDPVKIMTSIGLVENPHEVFGVSYTLANARTNESIKIGSRQLSVLHERVKFEGLNYG